MPPSFLEAVRNLRLGAAIARRTAAGAMGISQNQQAYSHCPARRPFGFQSGCADPCRPKPQARARPVEKFTPRVRWRFQRTAAASDWRIWSLRKRNGPESVPPPPIKRPVQGGSLRRVSKAQLRTGARANAKGAAPGNADMPLSSSWTYPHSPSGGPARHAAMRAADCAGFEKNGGTVVPPYGAVAGDGGTVVPPYDAGCRPCRVRDD